MSLINDALKKARQAQATAPVRSSAPQLRSPETDHPLRSGPSFVLPAIIVAVGLAGAALVWMAMSGHRLEVGKIDPVATANLPSHPPGPGQSIVSSPHDVVSARPAAAAARATEPPPAVVSPPATLVTVTPTTPVPEPPAVPASLKLNGIFYNPARPTAIVNNKLVSTGSRVGALTVLAIRQSSVTLVGGGRTNVLSLSE